MNNLGNGKSEIFKDGTHKRGGTIYAINTFDAYGKYTGRVTLGVLFKRNRVAAADGQGAYASNDWTAARDDSYKTRATRKQAMAIIEAAAARVPSTELAPTLI